MSYHEDFYGRARALVDQAIADGRTPEDFSIQAAEWRAKGFPERAAFQDTVALMMHQRLKEG